MGSARRALGAKGQSMPCGVQLGARQRGRSGDRLRSGSRGRLASRAQVAEDRRGVLGELAVAAMAGQRRRSERGLRAEAGRSTLGRRAEAPRYTAGQHCHESEPCWLSDLEVAAAYESSVFAVDVAPVQRILCDSPEWSALLGNVQVLCR